MAYIKKIKRKKGTVYKAEVRLRGHQYTSKTFFNLKDARAWSKRTEMMLKLEGYKKEDLSIIDQLSALTNEVEQLKKAIHKTQENFQQNGS